MCKLCAFGGRQSQVCIYFLSVSQLAAGARRLALTDTLFALPGVFARVGAKRTSLFMCLVATIKIIYAFYTWKSRPLFHSPTAHIFS